MNINNMSWDGIANLVPGVTAEQVSTKSKCAHEPQNILQVYFPQPPLALLYDLFMNF